MFHNWCLKLLFQVSIIPQKAVKNLIWDKWWTYIIHILVVKYNMFSWPSLGWEIFKFCQTAEVTAPKVASTELIYVLRNGLTTIQYIQFEA